MGPTPFAQDHGGQGPAFLAPASQGVKHRTDSGSLPGHVGPLARRQVPESFIMSGMAPSPSRRRGPLRSPPLTLAALAMIVVGCGDDPMAPRPLPALHRTVRVVVSDSLGAPAAGVNLRLVSDGDSAGIARVVTGTTDPMGALEAVLIEGDWGVHGFRAPRAVAGATFEVPGRTRPAVDTIEVALTLHIASVARGRARLAGRTDHSGIVVDCPPVPAAQVTDTSGTYVIDLLPRGHWTITMFLSGFKLGLAPIDVTASGQSLNVPDVVLTSDPLP